MKYTIAPFGEDFIITVLEEGDFYGIPFKVVNLNFEEEGDSLIPTFEIELPKDKAHLFKSEEFLKLAEAIVGEATITATTSVYKETQKEVLDIETKLKELLDSHKVSYDTDKLILGQFMDSGFFVLDEKGKLTCIDMKTNQEYDLRNENEFDEIRQKVFPSIILTGLN
jgi:hypothetical protein